MDFNKVRTVMLEEMENERISQAKFSRKMGTDPSYHGKFLRKESKKIGFNHVAKFCEIYNISMDWLFFDIGEKYLKNKHKQPNTEIKLTEIEAKNKLIFMLESENKRLEEEIKSLKSKKSFF